MEHVRKGSNKDRMLAGHLYEGEDPQLVAERENARRLMRIINVEDGVSDRNTSALRELFPNVGENAIVTPPVWTCTCERV